MIYSNYLTAFKNTITLILLCSLFNLNQLSAQGNALSFDGINDKVDISNSPSLNFAISNKFSIEAWFKTTATNYRILVSNRIDVAPYTGYEFMLNSGALDFSIISTNLSNSMKVLTVNNTFNDGNWHHAAVVYRGIPNGNNVDIFVDGILQAKTVPANTLSGIITNTNLVTIGARQLVTAYNFNGSIDEVRIWNKELCAQEILAKKNCQLIGNEYGLVAYYNFNQGVAASTNATVTNLTDLTTSNNTGTLTGFALNGASSNWIASTASVTGNCAPYGPLLVNGNTTLCIGATSSTTLTASGANTYTWSTSANTASISVSPTVNTTYSVVAIDNNTCTTSQTISVWVNPLPTVSATTNSSLICTGQSSTLNASGAATYTWNTNSNATTVVVNPTVTTTYTVSGTSTAGCTNSSLITQSVSLCTNINNSSLSNDKINVSVFPNPNKGEFKIQTEIEIINGEIIIVNAIGQKVFEQKIAQGTNEIKTTGFPSGLYTLVVLNNKQLISTCKLSIE
jgi:hypothetical protein